MDIDPGKVRGKKEFVVDATPPARPPTRLGYLVICLLPALTAAGGVWAGLELLRSDNGFIATGGAILILGSLVGAMGTCVMVGAVLFAGGGRGK